MPDLTARVGQVVDNLLARYDIPGMAVAVTYNGQVVLAQGYGVTGVAGTAVSPDTPFAVGSLTKTFTAISTLMIAQNPALIDQNTNPGITSFSIDAPISTYFPDPSQPITLPDGTTFDLSSQWDNLTPRELLDMSSGLPDLGNGQPWNTQVDNLAMSSHSLEFTPDSQYLYSNTGFWLLGALVEQLSNMPYNEFVQDYIFNPLDMTDSTVLTGATTMAPGEAIGYDTYDPATNQGVQPSYYSAGGASFSAGAVVTSAADLGKYLSALWNESSVLLDPASYALMWTAVPLPTYPPPPSSTAMPGLGWDSITTTPNWTEIEKNGFIAGYSAQISLYQQDGFGIAVAYNLTNPTLDPDDPAAADNPNPATIIDALHATVDTAEVSGVVTAPGSTATPLAGWTVDLTASPNNPFVSSEQSTVTNAQGQYSFFDVPPGSVTITVVPPASGWWPASGSTASAALVAQASDTLLQDFSFSPLVTVSQVRRDHFMRSTVIELSFLGPLDSDTVTNRADYALSQIHKLRRPGSTRHTEIPIRKVVFDAATQTVTLVVRQPHALRGMIQVEVFGPNVTNTAGVPLDGNGNGTPGSNFVETI